MGKNKWSNADLESGVTPWVSRNGSTVVQSSTQAWEQTNSLRFNGTSTYAGIHVNSPGHGDIVGSQQYTFSVYIYCESAGININIKMYDQDNNWLGQSLGNSTTEDTWVRLSLTFSTGAGDTGLRPIIEKNNNSDNGYIYIDAIQVEEGGSATTWENYSSGIDLTIQELAHSFALDAPIVQRVLGLTVAALDHDFSVGGSITPGWEVGPYVYPDTGLIVAVVAGLTIADLAHAAGFDAPAVQRILGISVADLTHALELEGLTLEEIDGSSGGNILPILIAAARHRRR